jgi:DNA repair protein SbcC/Rad50
MMFGVNGGRFRSLLKLDPKARQMESYILDRQGVALASGKKEVFAEWTSKHVGSAGGFLASIFSSQRRNGNFLSSERSQRKELFITQLLGLERLRLISATARGFADEKGKKVLVLEGEKKGISQVLASESEVGDVEALGLELEALGSRLQGLEVRKGEQERRALELRSRESERRSLDPRRQDLHGRIEKSNDEIAELRRQIGEDKRLLARREGLDGFQERERAVGERIAQLHRQIEEAQQLEASNSEVKTALRAIEADMNMKRGDLNRSRAESEELESVPCGGQGPYAGCVKIRRAIQARQQVPVTEGELSTLKLELEAQRGSLATIPVSSAELARQLREVERERREVEAVRRRQDEMRIAEARRAERASALERAVREEAALAGQLLGMEKELEHFQGLEVEIKAVRGKLRK